MKRTCCNALDEGTVWGLDLHLVHSMASPVAFMAKVGSPRYSFMLQLYHFNSSRAFLRVRNTLYHASRFY